jgi:hypothetical protein
LFATGVIDTNTIGNSPPASLYRWQFASGIADTDGKFATGQQHQRNWWQNLLPVSLIHVANLPLVHLDLRIYQQIFEKNLNDPSFIFKGLGEDES